MPAIKTLGLLGSAAKLAVRHVFSVKAASKAKPADSSFVHTDQIDFLSSIGLW